MDDHDSGSGLSGWAWYRLGQASARRQVSVAETTAVLLGRRSPSIDVNAVLAQNQALANENATLRNEISLYRQNYNTLKAWADEASIDLQKYYAQHQ
jgi:hypothetical protein